MSERPKPRPPAGGAPPPLGPEDAATEPRIRGPVIRTGAETVATGWED